LFGEEDVQKVGRCRNNARIGRMEESIMENKKPIFYLILKYE